MNLIKTKKDIELIKKACDIWKLTREAISSNVKVGISLNELDLIAKEVILKNGGTSAFFKYLDFPKNICISVNDCLIHGVPTDYLLKDGDMVTFDVGVKYQEHFCDAAFTIIIGEGTLEAKRINDVCYTSLMKAIEILKPGILTKDIAAVIQDYTEANGYELIRNFTGHGCGNAIHEDPSIPNYRSSFFKKEKLLSGMVICIEPMTMTKSNKYYINPKDNWSVMSLNKKLTCHWEHMILITDTGYEILTK